MSWESTGRSKNKGSWWNRKNINENEVKIKNLWKREEFFRKKKKLMEKEEIRHFSGKQW